MKLGCGLILFVILLLGVWVWFVEPLIADERRAEIAAERDLCARGDDVSCGKLLNRYNRELWKHPGVRRHIDEYKAQKQENPALSGLEFARDLCDERGDEASCIMWSAYNRALGNGSCSSCRIETCGLTQLQICAGYEAHIKQENPALTKREYTEKRRPELRRRFADEREAESATERELRTARELRAYRARIRVPPSCYIRTGRRVCTTPP